MAIGDENRGIARRWVTLKLISSLFYTGLTLVEEVRFATAMLWQTLADDGFY